MAIYALAPDNSPKLNKKETTRIQSIIGSLLYYARGIDQKILPALNTLATTQAFPTEMTWKYCHHFLDYVATYPNVKV